MKIDISKPAEVHRNIGKAYGAMAVYADMLESCNQEVRKLDQRITECEETITKKEREITIILESLRQYSNDQPQSQEAEKQRREQTYALECCKAKKRCLQTIREETATLSREATRIHQSARSIADCSKKIAMRARAIVEDWLSFV